MTAHTNLELIESARAVISDPNNWHQGCLFKGSDGLETGLLSKACSYCSLGALHKVAYDWGDSLFLYDATRELKKTIDDSFNYSIWDYNDNVSHEKVLEMFDETIKRLKAENE